MNLDEDPKTKTKTVAFGDRPAAAICTVAIKETAELFEQIELYRKDLNLDWDDDIPIWR